MTNSKDRRKQGEIDRKVRGSGIGSLSLNGGAKRICFNSLYMHVQHLRRRSISSVRLNLRCRLQLNDFVLMRSLALSLPPMFLLVVIHCIPVPILFVIDCQSVLFYRCRTQR